MMVCRAIMLFLWAAVLDPPCKDFQQNANGVFYKRLMGVFDFSKEDLVMRNRKTRASKRLFCAAYIIVMLMLCSSASGDEFTWDNGGDGALWTVPGNWEPDGVPGITDQATINLPDANCLIAPSVTASCATLYIGDGTGPGYLGMTGGELTMTSHLRIGEPSGSTGVFNMSSGTVSTGGGRLWIGISGNGTLFLTGGVLTCADKLELGKNSSGNGTVHLRRATLNITGGSSDDLEIAKYGTGTIYVYGGELNIADNIKMGQGGGTGRIYIYGGTVNNGNENPEISDSSLIDITAGRLVLPGDATLPINEHIANGRITAYDGGGRVVVVYDSDEDQTEVTSAEIDPILAWDPSPANWATVQKTPDGPIIGWEPGQYAVSHEVYFGPDHDDVNDANNAPGKWAEYRGNQDPCSYDPGPLDLGVTYYWRIDEVNDNAWAPSGSPWKGIVWEFTVADYSVVDNMESYTPWTIPGDNIFETWRDGVGNCSPGNGNGTGATLYENGDPVSGGVQCMKYVYDNDGTAYNPCNEAQGPRDHFYSAAKAQIVDIPSGITSDWITNGARALSLEFHGTSGNSIESMWVELTDGTGRAEAIAYGFYDDEDPNNIAQASWQEWIIDLQDFNDGGVDLGDVNSIGIGFGEVGAASPGGSGTVYFDDIRLYGARCITSHRSADFALADYAEDYCVVDSRELEVMAGDWLESDYMAVGGDGTLENFANDDSQWVDDPTRGGTLQLDGIDDWVDIDDAQMSNFHDRTISLWVNIKEYSEPYPYVFSFQNAGDAPYRIYLRTRGNDIVRARFVEDYLPDFTAGTNVWSHLAFVIRDTADGLCTGEFYGNGTLAGQLVGQPRHSGGATGVSLGSFGDGSSGLINAAFDDFRVYERALAGNEVAYLAGLPSGVEPTAEMLLYYKFDEVSGLVAENFSAYVFNRPLLSLAELHADEGEGSRVINFKDLAVLARFWLDEQFWPQP